MKLNLKRLDPGARLAVASLMYGIVVSCLVGASRVNADQPVSTGKVITPTNAPVIPSGPAPATLTNSSIASSTNRVQTVVSSGAQAGGTNKPVELDDKHLLAIGDRLSFQIIEDAGEPKSLVVTDSGELEVPYIGRYMAVGKTCRNAATEIKAALEKDYYFHANVTLAVDSMTKSRGKVYLVGAVRSAGPEDLPSDEILTLSKAILRAGGFTDYADRKHVKVTRKDPVSKIETKAYTVDVAEILEKGRLEFDLPLDPGDFIFVPDRLVRF